MTIAPDEPLSTPDEDSPADPGAGDVPPAVTEPDVEGDAESAAPSQVEDE